MSILRHLIGLSGIAAIVIGVLGIVRTLTAAPPVEIDPTARIYFISAMSEFPKHYTRVKDPAFHQNGSVTFKNSAGKAVIFGPAVQWIAEEL
jgi:hypothetical protein